MTLFSHDRAESESQSQHRAVVAFVFAADRRAPRAGKPGRPGRAEETWKAGGRAGWAGPSRAGPAGNGRRSPGPRAGRQKRAGGAMVCPAPRRTAAAPAEGVSESGATRAAGVRRFGVAGLRAPCKESTLIDGLTQGDDVDELIDKLTPIHPSIDQLINQSIDSSSN